MGMMREEISTASLTNGSRRKFETHKKWCRVTPQPVLSVGGTVVSTFGTSQRFPDPLWKTPGPQQYDTRFNHPGVIKHCFRAKHVQQILGSGLRDRTQNGTVVDSKDVYIPNFPNAQQAASGGPQHYHPQYPDLVRNTFNIQLQREQSSYQKRMTPKKPHLELPETPPPFFRNLARSSTGGSTLPSRSPGMKFLA